MDDLVDEQCLEVVPEFLIYTSKSRRAPRSCHSFFFLDGSIWLMIKDAEETYGLWVFEPEQRAHVAKRMVECVHIFPFELSAKLTSCARGGCVKPRRRPKKSHGTPKRNNHSKPVPSHLPTAPLPLPTLRKVADRSPSRRSLAMPRSAIPSKSKGKHSRRLCSRRANTRRQRA